MGVYNTIANTIGDSVIKTSPIYSSSDPTIVALSELTKQLFWADMAMKQAI